MKKYIVIAFLFSGLYLNLYADEGNQEESALLLDEQLESGKGKSGIRQWFAKLFKSKKQNATQSDSNTPLKKGIEKNIELGLNREISVVKKAFTTFGGTKLGLNESYEEDLKMLAMVGTVRYDIESELTRVEKRITDKKLRDYYSRELRYFKNIEKQIERALLYSLRKADKKESDDDVMALRRMYFTKTRLWINKLKNNAVDSEGDEVVQDRKKPQEVGSIEEQPIVPVRRKKKNAALQEISRVENDVHGIETELTKIDSDLQDVATLLETSESEIPLAPQPPDFSNLNPVLSKGQPAKNDALLAQIRKGTELRHVSKDNRNETSEENFSLGNVLKKALDQRRPAFGGNENIEDSEWTD